MSDSILWRRLDTPGHDACRLEQVEGGWRLQGAAAFRHEGAPAYLAYELTCDAAWRTREGAVRGALGSRAVELLVQRGWDGAWTLNGRSVPHLEGCVDLDLGFTPATNASQLRRLALPVGDAAQVPVAWLDVASGSLDLLEQRYERRAVEAYDYEAPRFGYAAQLEVESTGFPREYPGLWTAER